MDLTENYGVRIFHEDIAQKIVTYLLMRMYKYETLK